MKQVQISDMQLREESEQRDRLTLAGNSTSPKGGDVKRMRGREEKLTSHSRHPNATSADSNAKSSGVYIGHRNMYLQLAPER